MSETDKNIVACDMHNCDFFDGVRCTGRPGIDCYSGTMKDMVNHPQHYGGGIDVIDYIRDKLTPEELTGFCMGNVLKYCSRWRKKDGVQDLKKAKVYLEWAIQNEEGHDGD